MTTILVHAPALAHTKLHHPENSSRIAHILPELDRFGLLDEVALVGAEPASREQVRRVHTQGLFDYVEMVCAHGGGLLDGGDTYATAESLDLARLAVGGCCTAIDHIMNGRADNGFALIRPPGHHAESDRVSGFCLFNNVAAAARQAQLVHGAQRIFILDIDVHHGNGTQGIFYEDESVLFASMHLFAPFFYPGIGSLHEIGTRNGRGYTINVPFPPNVGDVGYMRVLQEFLVPTARRFAPELILISIGYDAHWQDPLAMAGVSLMGYALMGQVLIRLANEICDGRILFVLEGGYQQEVLDYGIINTLSALLGHDSIFDPFGAMPDHERDISALLAQLRERDLPF
jgi:acetoin utilization deacetylase AcuC-like enzyme